MNLLDIGSGPPVVVIPGVEGRWEWIRPAIDALAARCRVITFSLCDEPTANGCFDERTGFACYVEQVREALDQCGLGAAAICGVSYGGLIAAAFAARYPNRVTALVLASAVPPSWTPDRRIRMYLRAPRLMAFAFGVMSPLSMYPELAAAVPRPLDRLRLALKIGWLVVSHPSSPARMACRARLIAGMTPLEMSKVDMPTLVITGEPALDLIVPVRMSLEYARLIPHARLVTLERTGHVGVATRPEAFADIVGSFVSQHGEADDAGGVRHAV